MITIDEIVKLSDTLRNKLVKKEDGNLYFTKYSDIKTILDPIFNKKTKDKIDNVYKQIGVSNSEKERCILNLQLLYKCYGIYQCIMFYENKKDEALFIKGINNIEKSIKLYEDLQEIGCMSSFGDFLACSKSSLDKIRNYDRSESKENFIKYLNRGACN